MIRGPLRGQPVRVLAERAQVSKPTVVRFCRSMGYDGLADFKLKLVGSVSEGVPFVHRSVDAAMTRRRCAGQSGGQLGVRLF